jgi:hypothetical protein
MMTPASNELSLNGVLRFQMYMRMRGIWPSGGVAKLALLVPEPSWVLRMTSSAPFPPAPYQIESVIDPKNNDPRNIDNLTLLLTSKLPAASLNPSVWRRSWYMLEV